jgi:hypothetical protein
VQAAPEACAQAAAALGGEKQGKKKPATQGGSRHRYSIQKNGTGEYYAKIISSSGPTF